VFVSSAALNIKACVTPSTDLVNVVSGGDYKTAKPSTCSATATPVTDVVDKVQTVISNPTTLSTALQQFASDLTALATQVDPTTGVVLGKDFTLAIVAVASPVKNADQSLTLSVLVMFIPIGSVPAPTADHERVYCPIVIKLLAATGGFQVTDLSGVCTWTLQPSAKRAASSSTIYSTSSTANSAVSNLYGSNAVVQSMSLIMLLVVLVVMALLL